MKQNNWEYPNSRSIVTVTVLRGFTAVFLGIQSVRHISLRQTKRTRCAGRKARTEGARGTCRLLMKKPDSKKT